MLQKNYCHVIAATSGNNYTQRGLFIGVARTSNRRLRGRECCASRFEASWNRASHEASRPRNLRLLVRATSDGALTAPSF